MSPVTQDKLVNYLMDRTDKFGNYINELAKQLGVAAAHVYGVLIRQQYVDAVSSLFTDAIYIIIIILISIAFVKLWKKTLLELEDGNDGWLFATIFVSIFFAAITIPSTIFLLINIKESLMKLMNPEYYALKDIMTFIQSKVQK